MSTSSMTTFAGCTRTVIAVRSLPRVVRRSVGRERQAFGRPFKKVLMATSEPAEAPAEETQQASKVSSYEASQKAAPRLSYAELARSLMARSSTGVLGNISYKKTTEGFPSVSYVEFLTDDKGRPLFGFSTLSPRTREILADGRCSLLALEGAAMKIWSEKLSLTGTVTKLEGKEAEDAKAFYMTKKPNAFWLDFGDVSLYRMDDFKSLYYTSNIGIGLGRVSHVSVSEYVGASVDPVAVFSEPICKHMNEDHSDSNVAMVNHYSGIKVDSAKMLRIDRLGFELICSKGDNLTIPCRLVFPRPVETRKEVRDVIVEMTQDAAAAMKSKASPE